MHGSLGRRKKKRETREHIGTSRSKRKTRGGVKVLVGGSSSRLEAAGSKGDDQTFLATTTSFVIVSRNYNCPTNKTYTATLTGSRSFLAVCSHASGDNLLQSKTAPPPPPKGIKPLPAKVRKVPEVVEFYHSLMRRESRRDSCNGSSSADVAFTTGENKTHHRHQSPLHTGKRTTASIIDTTTHHHHEPPLPLSLNLATSTSTSSDQQSSSPSRHTVVKLQEMSGSFNSSSNGDSIISVA